MATASDRIASHRGYRSIPSGVWPPPAAAFWATDGIRHLTEDGTQVLDTGTNPMALVDLVAWDRDGERLANQPGTVGAFLVGQSVFTVVDVQVSLTDALLQPAGGPYTARVLDGENTVRATLIQTWVPPLRGDYQAIWAVTYDTTARDVWAQGIQVVANPSIATYDPATGSPRDRLRFYIPDTNTQCPIFPDIELDALLLDASGGVVSPSDIVAVSSGGTTPWSMTMAQVYTAASLAWEVISASRSKTAITESLGLFKRDGKSLVQQSRDEAARYRSLALSIVDGQNTPTDGYFPFQWGVDPVKSYQDTHTPRANRPLTLW